MAAGHLPATRHPPRFFRVLLLSDHLLLAGGGDLTFHDLFVMAPAGRLPEEGGFSRRSGVDLPKMAAVEQQRAGGGAAPPEVGPRGRGVGLAGGTLPN